MATKKTKSTIHPVRHEGEGFRLPFEPMSSGPGNDQYRLEFAHAPAPSHKFVADEFAILEAAGKLRFVFVQLNVLGKPRALVDVHSQLGAVQQFAEVFKSFSPIDAPQAQIKIEEEPSEAIALWATFARASIAAPISACIDFYYTSPFALGAGRMDLALYAQDVVRIQMTDVMLQSFVMAMREVLAKLSP